MTSEGGKQTDTPYRESLGIEFIEWGGGRKRERKRIEKGGRGEGREAKAASSEGQTKW